MLNLYPKLRNNFFRHLLKYAVTGEDGQVVWTRGLLTSLRKPMIIEERGGIYMLKVYFTRIWWVGVLLVVVVVVELSGEFRPPRTSSRELKLQCKKKTPPHLPPGACALGLGELRQAATGRSAANGRRSLLLWDGRKSALPHAGRNAVEVLYKNSIDPITRFCNQNFTMAKK